MRRPERVVCTTGHDRVRSPGQRILGDRRCPLPSALADAEGRPLAVSGQGDRDRRRSQQRAALGEGEFTGGQLSFDQVAVVARYAPAHVEPSVAEFALNTSVPQLNHSLSRYSFDPPAENDHEQGSTTGDSEAGNNGAGDNGADDAAPGDTQGGDPPSWNGFALQQDHASAPAQLSTSYDQWAKDALFKAGQPKVTLGDTLIEIAGPSLATVKSINRRDASSKTATATATSPAATPPPTSNATT